MFLSKISMHSCTIIHCIVKEKMFVVIVFIFSLQTLKRHIKDCFKINGKQRIIMPKKGEYFKLKTSERKIKSLFVI